MSLARADDATRYYQLTRIIELQTHVTHNKHDTTSALHTMRITPTTRTLTHTVRVIPSSTFTRDDTQIESTRHATITHIMTSLTHTCFTHVSYRSMLLYTLCRDVYHVLPDNLPHDECYPSDELMVATLIHTLCTTHVTCDDIPSTAHVTCNDITSTSHHIITSCNTHIQPRLTITRYVLRHYRCMTYVASIIQQLDVATGVCATAATTAAATSTSATPTPTSTAASTAAATAATAESISATSVAAAELATTSTSDAEQHLPPFLFDWCDPISQDMLVHMVLHDDITRRYPCDLRTTHHFWSGMTRAMEQRHHALHDALVTCVMTMVRDGAMASQWSAPVPSYRTFELTARPAINKQQSHTTIDAGQAFPCMAPAPVTSHVDDTTPALCTLRMAAFNGRVGLSGWPAGFRLSELIMDRPQLFEGRRVLELGAGMSYAGSRTDVLCGCKLCSMRVKCVHVKRNNVVDIARMT